VNNTTLIDQWQERIDEFLDVPGGVGVIQGPPETWDWEGRGICVGMIHSLALRHEELPQGMDRYFGLVIYDEVHHLSAPLFSQTAPLFYGERHGLTATNSREDGLEVIYQYHIGEAYHRDLSQDMKPRIYFQQCPVTIDPRNPAVSREVLDKGGRLNIPKLRNYLGSLSEVNDFIAEKLQAPLASGRKVLVLSHSVDQLRRLNEMFEDSGLCTGREKPRKRLDTLRTKQLSFGTLQLVKEALDEDTLDTLYFITPFGSQEIEEGGFNTLQQGMGRIQRFREGKKTPVVVILDHVYISKLHRMCSKLKRLLRSWPAEQGGPLDYTVLRPHSQEATNE
jgi:superfamily II DNA or RNA helicase